MTLTATEFLKSLCEEYSTLTLLAWADYLEEEGNNRDARNLQIVADKGWKPWHTDIDEPPQWKDVSYCWVSDERVENVPYDREVPQSCILPPSLWKELKCDLTYYPCIWHSYSTEERAWLGLLKAMENWKEEQSD